MSSKPDFFETIKKKYLDNLSPEEVKQYERFGEKFYALDFSKQKIDDGKKVINLEESLANICRGLQSGLHPSFISEEEERLLKAAYGEEWYKKFGYDSKTL
jgi:hypothetical protein